MLAVALSEGYFGAGISILMSSSALSFLRMGNVHS